MKRTMTAISMMVFLVVTVVAQSGGNYSITQRVISNGGGTSANGSFEVTGTIGQTVTATSSGASFQAISGFWQPNFVPTSAGVTLAGRVRTADGRGLSNAVVVAIDQLGTVRSARTGSFGYYLIDGLAAGQTVTVRVESRRFQFTPQIVELSDNLEEINFTSVSGDGF